MNGVVLWSCEESQRVIVWCEDHGQLAYARGAENFVRGGAFPGVGDLIAFDLRTVAGVRQCRAVRIVMRDSFPDIARTLKGAAAGAPERRQPERRRSAEVVPFARVAATA